MECNYFLGRIYLEKLKLKMLRSICQYLNSNHNDYRDEANYLYEYTSNKEIKYIPQSIILQRND